MSMFEQYYDNTERTHCWRASTSDYTYREQRTDLCICPTMGYGRDGNAQLKTWFTKTAEVYQIISAKLFDPDRPRKLPKLVKMAVEVNNSRRTWPIAGYAEATLAKALVRDELRGEAMTDALHVLFRKCLVDNEPGLDYLVKYASSRFSEMQLWTRRHDFVAFDRNAVDCAIISNDSHNVKACEVEDCKQCDEISTSVWQVSNAISKHVYLENDNAIEARVNKRVCEDPSYRDALMAILTTDEAEEIQVSQLKNFVELHMHPVDRVIGTVLDNTTANAKQQWLGLRACQQAQSNSDFVTAVDDFIQHDKSKTRLRKFLQAKLRELGVPNV